MARVASTKIDVEDLEFAVEYLVRLSYSSLRVSKFEENRSIVAEREEILEVALEVERLVGMVAIGDTEGFVKRVDSCCTRLEIVIKKTINNSGLQKMRTAIRQKRLRNSPDGLLTAYKSLSK